MWRVQLRCTVTSPVRVGSATTGRSMRRLDQGRPHQGPVGPGHDLELPRDPVGAGHRDAGGQAAAVVAVSAERAVLVPRDVRDALVTPMGLNSASMRLASASPAVPVAGERGDRGRSAGHRRRPPCAARLLVEVLHAHQPLDPVGGGGPPRAAVARRVAGRRRRPCRPTPRPSPPGEHAVRWRKPAASRKCAQVAGFVVRVKPRPRSSGEPSRSTKCDLPGEGGGTPSRAPRSSSHQSRRSDNLPVQARASRRRTSPSAWPGR